MQKPSSFATKVYAAVCSIPRGYVATYGQIAQKSGRPQAYRAIGNIIHANPVPSRIPCHRVVDQRGSLSVRFAFGGLEGQQKKLHSEKIKVKDGVIDLKKYQINF